MSGRTINDGIILEMEYTRVLDKIAAARMSVERDKYDHVRNQAVNEIYS